MSSNRHEPPTSRRGSAALAKLELLGDEERLYAAHADKLRRVVGAAVRTSEANVEDACSFAWLQLLDIAGCYTTNDTSFAAWTRRRAPQPGDIVFTREAPAGEAAVIPSHGSWCLGQRSVLLVADRGLLNPDFVVLALYGRAVKEEIILRARSTTAAHLNVREIGELPIPMPPVERQIEAACEFAAARSRFSVLQTETQAVSATLVEYRDALITQAVTGELDVTKVGESQMMSAWQPSARARNLGCLPDALRRPADREGLRATHRR